MRPTVGVLSISLPSECFVSVFRVVTQETLISQTAEDDDGNVGKTIRLITADKKHTWICEIRLTFVPSYSQMRLQLLHFHAVFKMWATFPELISVVSFRRRHWSQWNFSENRNMQGNQSKDTVYLLNTRIRETCFSCLPMLASPSSFAQGPYSKFDKTCWECFGKIKTFPIHNRHSTLFTQFSVAAWTAENF